MQIMDIREVAVPLEASVSNASVSFSGHTVSLVAVISDVVRDGVPVAGLAFNSIGRFAQGGILRERIVPRLLGAEPDSLLDEDTSLLSAWKVQAAAMRGEKPGGHGDRSSAVGAVELAVWDLNAKLGDEPAYAAIARKFGLEPRTGGIDAYAAGGYYAPGFGTSELADEIRAYQDEGYTAFKIKIGGAPLTEDLSRVEAVVEVAGDGASVAVDANGRFDLPSALQYADALEPYCLRWLEEPGDPLDFEVVRALADRDVIPIATGENLFSVPDVRNLLRYGGMRPGIDIFQMDAGLSYGLCEYARTIELLEASGHPRACIYPHGGHVINLHVVAGLQLGGCEMYPRHFRPVSGIPSPELLRDGVLAPPSAPGFGIERMPGLRPWVAKLLS